MAMKMTPPAGGKSPAPSRGPAASSAARPDLPPVPEHELGSGWNDVAAGARLGIMEDCYVNGQNTGSTPGWGADGPESEPAGGGTSGAAVLSTFFCLGILYSLYICFV